MNSHVQVVGGVRRLYILCMMLEFAEAVLEVEQAAGLVEHSVVTVETEVEAGTEEEHAFAAGQVLQVHVLAEEPLCLDTLEHVEEQLVELSTDKDTVVVLVMVLLLYVAQDSLGKMRWEAGPEEQVQEGVG